MFLSQGAGFALAGVVACGWMWDSWSLRAELDRLKEANAAALRLEKLAPALVLPAAPVPSRAVSLGCACGAPSPVAPATAATGGSAQQGHSDAVAVIPPGANLLEAIKIIQREQAKNTPAAEAAGVSPFGAPR